MAAVPHAARRRPARPALGLSALARSLAALGLMSASVVLTSVILAPASLAAPAAAQVRAASRLQLPEPPALLRFEPVARPALAGFGAARVAPTRSNAALAREFTDLMFHLERGAPRRLLPKWTPPVAVSLDPQLEPGFGAFLDDFLAQIRARSGVDIRLESQVPFRGLPAHQEEARIVVRLAPTFSMMRRLGTSFCVAAPGDVTWKGYGARLDGAEPDAPNWSRLLRPTTATVFAPDRARPFQIRSCLMEEIMQALGPAGDFFGLSDSIFNDDGARQQPTDFDFLTLRVLYDPRLVAGMTEAETLAAARAVLDELRPEGRGGDDRAETLSDPQWLESVHAARAQRHPKFAERFYAEAATRAARFAPDDQRRLFTEFERAGNLARYAPRQALEMLDDLERRQMLVASDELRAALVTLRRAEVLLSLGRFEEAGADAGRALPVFVAHGREDALAEALLTRRAAQRQVRQIHTDQPLPPEDAAWRDYVYGLEALLPVMVDARPPPSIVALSLALGLTATPLLLFLRLVARAF